LKKYLIFVAVIVVSLAADLVTKQWAIDNLASPYWEHSFERTVAPELAGKTAVDWAASEFGLAPTSTDAERLVLTSRLLDGSGVERRLLPTATLQGGERIKVRQRDVTVVEGFWNHTYVRNHGAAWGMFSQHDESFRKPFFMTISIVALVFVLWIFRGVGATQYLMITTLALIVGGALGNFVDRIRFGYVVDFIDWYVTLGGRERHWPTFNIADVCISVGVTLMILQSFFVKEPGDKAAEPTPPEGDDRRSPVA
jgi:lipoprotein signal peptidase